MSVSEVIVAVLVGVLEDRMMAYESAATRLHDDRAKQPLSPSAPLPPRHLSAPRRVLPTVAAHLTLTATGQIPRRRRLGEQHGVVRR